MVASTGLLLILQRRADSRKFSCALQSILTASNSGFYGYAAIQIKPILFLLAEISISESLPMGLTNLIRNGELSMLFE